MANWKTTTCGILAVIFAYVVGHPTDFPAWVVSIGNVLQPLSVTLGLVFAKDATKTEKPK